MTSASARERDYQRKLLNEIKRLTHLLNRHHWTPQQVEEETLQGYEEPWHTTYDEIVARKAALKLSRATVMADWQIERLNAWRRAVALGGEHYQQWRAAFITPIEEGRGNAHLARHQISKLKAEDAKGRKLYEEFLASMSPEERADWLRLSPASDTPACE